MNQQLQGEVAQEQQPSQLAVDELVQQAASGDVDAFGFLYQKYIQRTVALCLRMTSSHADAEDLAQEVWVQVFAKLHLFRGESSFTTWLHRVTFNQVLMHFRTKRFKCELTTTDGELPVVVVPGTELAGQVSAIDHMALEAAMDQLPDGYKNVLLLKDIMGWEYSEIAEKLGCSEGTCKSQLHKARKRMQQLLQQTQKPTRRSTKARVLAEKVDAEYKVILPQVSEKYLRKAAAAAALDEED